MKTAAPIRMRPVLMTAFSMIFAASSGLLSHRGTSSGFVTWPMLFQL
ncbi:MAG: hypothetical protein ACEROO_05020 [Candidatus Bathyarchaeota archaeon]